MFNQLKSFPVSKKSKRRSQHKRMIVINPLSPNRLAWYLQPAVPNEKEPISMERCLSLAKLYSEPARRMNIESPDNRS